MGDEKKVKVIVVDNGRDHDISDWIPEATMDKIREAYDEFKRSESWC